jgi:demethylmenaquinone methyltransferase / 2-methoxy-6-polyprenyl-1,4-benzoquinol methylase
LDVASGTADVLIALVKGNQDIVQAVGIDPATGMLAIGAKKIKRAGLSGRVMLQGGDAQHLPFLNETFDCVTISFGVRNIPDLRLGLLEIYRVTKKDGRVLVLEFSKPDNPLLRLGHWVYLNTAVPLIGFLFSGNIQAYRYLSRTIASFPYGEQFCKILRQFGFVDVQAYPLMGGVATIYVAQK